MTPDDRARLAALRGRLDALDDELLALVARRAAVVDEVAALKRAAGEALHDAGREAAIRARLVAARPGRLGAGEVEALAEAVLRACSPGSTSGGASR